MQPQPEGGTLREHLAAYKRATGKHHAEDRVPIKPPTSLFYLYGWFQDLSSGRPIGGMGTLLPVPPSEIKAWCDLHERRLQDWELECLRLLDSAFLRVMTERV